MIKWATNRITFIEIVRPHTEELLDIKQGDLVLDIACGNGNFSQRMAERGAEVIAFDYSQKMIDNAKRRRADFLDRISFFVRDATRYEDIVSLKQARLFDKAVSNMAIMDISNIEPLFKAVYELLSGNGVFVFSTHHPCFVKPDGQYKTPSVYKGEAIIGQPAKQNCYHRSMQDILSTAFDSGFVMDRFFEETDDDPESPVIFIARLKKI